MGEDGEGEGEGEEEGEEEEGIGVGQGKVGEGENDPGGEDRLCMDLCIGHQKWCSHYNTQCPNPCCRICAQNKNEKHFSSA